jgi:hypothetical protein
MMEERCPDCKTTPLLGVILCALHGSAADYRRQLIEYQNLGLIASDDLRKMRRFNNLQIKTGRLLAEVKP